MAESMTRWWTRVPETFAVVRDRKDMVVGFYCVFEPGRVSARFLREDPVTRAWIEHLYRQPLP